MNQTEIVSKNIRRLMIKNDLNQAELARKAGLTEVTISRYVNASRLPSTRVINKLTNALNCTYNDLFKYEEEEKTQLETIIIKMCSSLTETEKEYLVSILKK